MPGFGCATLDEVRHLLGECTRCRLAATRTHIVFGVGDPAADVMLIGEAPGRNEDLKGEPFVGAAGKLLDELLGVAGLARSDVYIANVLKCRPPGNRDPLPDEVETCTPFLREQIRVISPSILVTLGNFATRFVVGAQVSITRVRGVPREVGRFTVLPTYHPAAAIYDQGKLDLIRADFELLGTLVAHRAEEEPVQERLF